jgi:hypothetical protein
MGSKRIDLEEIEGIDDYREMLERAGDEAEREGEEGREARRRDDLIDERLAALADEGIVGEAEAAAAAAPDPKRVTSISQPKPLNRQQIAFAQGVIEGKTKRQAYRDAYPNAKGSDSTISACAFQLLQNPRIKQMIESAWEETTEALADDLAAQRRYVSRALVALSKGGKQEGTRLRALELLGRAAGMFREQLVAAEKPITADDLRRELAGHLKLVGKGKV